jgi:hypothetical protein
MSRRYILLSGEEVRIMAFCHGLLVPMTGSSEHGLGLARKAAPAVRRAGHMGEGVPSVCELRRFLTDTRKRVMDGKVLSSGVVSDEARWSYV